jgi:4-amino-4-deoxy-L-arabinose transferase-like glycosyltransferase
MNRTGLSVVTTFDGRPDLWNVKPPLAIWLMALSVRLFGASEWALRLPTLLAAVGTVALTLAFAWRLTRSRFAALASALLLAFSFGFYGYHAAWSADYDALLCFFVTAYLLGLFEVLHRARPAAAAVLGCGFAVAFACLTKDVAGVLPGIGVAAYVLVRKRVVRLFRTPWYGVGLLLAASLVVGYYVVRTQASPGYLPAVLEADLGGRYMNITDGHERSFFYYFETFPEMFGLAPVVFVLLAAPFLRWPKTRAAAFLTYGACVCAGLLLVLSLSRTKHSWYALSLYPVLAIMTAVILARIGELATSRLSGSPRGLLIGRLAVTAAAVLMIEIGFSTKIDGLSANAATVMPGSGYGLTFADVFDRGFRRAVAIDHGKIVADFPEYAPVLHDYAMIWFDRGLYVSRMEPSAVDAITSGTAIVSCDPRFTPMLRARGAQLTTTPGCVAIGAHGSKR